MARHRRAARNAMSSIPQKSCEDGNMQEMGRGSLGTVDPAHESFSDRPVANGVAQIEPA